MAFVNIVILKWTNYPTKEVFEIINENASVNEEIIPTYKNGVDEDIEYFIHTTPIPQVNYDANYWNPVETKSPTTIASETFPNLNQYQSVHSLEERQEAEVFLAVDNAEKLANQEIELQIDNMEVLSPILRCTIKLAMGLELDPETEQPIIEAFIAEDDLIKANHDIAISLKQTIVEGGKPSIEQAFGLI